MENIIKAWHFVGETLRDGSPIPADGGWLEYDQPLVMCSAGFHCSVHPFDALAFAPGSTLCRVDSAGVRIINLSKLVSSRRRIAGRLNFENHLFDFARKQALKVIGKWDAPEIVKQYLITGNPLIRSAAWSAARSAAESAAWSAAGSAAGSAARSAARSAEIKWQKQHLNKLMKKLFKESV